MDAIPVMPVSPAPVNETNAAPRDANGCDAQKGFGDALKQGMAARSPDAKDAKDSENAKDATDKADEKPISDASADDNAKSAAEAQSLAVLDPAVAALLRDATGQQPVPLTPAAIPPVQQRDGAAAGASDPAVGEVSAAQTNPAAVQRALTGRPAEQRIDDRGLKVAGERTVAERAAFDGGKAERGMIERSALERTTERVAADRPGEGRGTGDMRDFRATTDADERLLAARDKSLGDASIMGGFTVDRGATAADAPLPVAAPASTLDALSASALGAKWSLPAASGTEASAPAATARVDTPLGTPGWGDAFQNKVVWMVDRQLERAELHINPPHLGPVDVMLNLTGDGAQIAFTSPHAAVRDAIESSLPDLRDALDQRGLSLGQATVGSDSGAAREQFAEQAREAARKTQNAGSTSAAPLVESPSRTLAAIVRRGLVDTFA